MEKSDTVKAFSKAHTIYKDRDGKRVCGVTTILSVLAKPALIKWANNLGLEGVDVERYVDTTARIGTLAHALVDLHVNVASEFVTEDLIQRDYSENEIVLAKASFGSYLNWERGHEMELIINETPIVSEQYKYGGTIDMYAKVDGVHCLIDLKSGSGIYDEHFYQVCAYAQLLREAGYPVDEMRILNIPRKEGDSFTEKIWTMDRDWERGFEIFKACKTIYDTQKLLRG